MQAYCGKCRAKKEMKNPKSITMKNGRPPTQGVCPTCGTKMFRLGKSQSLLSQQVGLKKAGYNKYPAFFLYLYRTFHRNVGFRDVTDVLSISKL